MFFKKFLKYYLPVFIWLGMIFYFSSIVDLRYRTRDIFSEIFLRKSAHFLEYFFLAFLFWRIFFQELFFVEKKAFFWSFLFLSLIAFSDEWRQSFVIGRSGKVIDSVYDIFSGWIFLQGNFFIQKKNWLRGFFLFLAVSGLIILEIWMIISVQKFGQQKINEQRILRANTFSEKEEKLIEKEAPIQKEELKEEIKAFVLPEKIKISVPFTSQAPFEVWDEYHKEACEEASLLMVAYFLQDKKLDRNIAEKELQAMIQFQIEKYGKFQDTSAEETVHLGKDYFGLNNLKVVYDFSLEELKKYLAQGNPIIIPAGGRLLKNPNFIAPGPLYHNLVLVGFEKDVIITNDPGTKKGERYSYAEQILFNAIHDFQGDKNQIEKGRKAMIVVEKKED